MYAIHALHNGIIAYYNIIFRSFHTETIVPESIIFKSLCLIIKTELNVYFNRALPNMQFVHKSPLSLFYSFNPSDGLRLDHLFCLSLVFIFGALN